MIRARRGGQSINHCVFDVYMQSALHAVSNAHCDATVFGHPMTHEQPKRRCIVHGESEGIQVAAWMPCFHAPWKLPSYINMSSCVALQVSLWDLDHPPAVPSVDGANDDDTSDYDGILMFAPHGDYVSALKWVGGAGAATAKLITSSWDTSVRVLDVNTGE